MIRFEILLPLFYNDGRAVEDESKEAKVRQPRYSKEEFARRGNELYETKIRPKVEPGNKGKVVAIDVDSGDFVVGEGTLIAAQRLMASHPDAQTWFVRIGYPGVHRFGPRLAKQPG